MELTSIIPWAVFIAITVMLFALFNAFSGQKSRATERLDELRDPGLRGGEKSGVDRQRAVNMLEKAAPALSKALQPKTELEQNDLKVRLANAGLNAPGAPQMYLATKVGLGLALTALGAAIGLINLGWTSNAMTAIAAAGALGFYGPDVWLAMRRSARMERIFLSLPDALDLMVVCTEAGLGLDAGMRRVSEELQDSATEVCFEFQMANMQLQMGRPRKEVLHDLGIRSGVDDMKALAAVLIQADKFGSSVAQALRVQSDTMRIKRRQMAEEKAQQTSVKMLIPLVIFIFPGVFVVLVGPAAIMMMNNLFQ